MRFMRLVREYWSDFLIMIVILIILFIVTFYLYPSFLLHLFVHHNKEVDLVKESEGFGRGTFGDMYGALNSFVSGLAFLSAIAAIFVQIYIHNRENENDKKKKENEENQSIEASKIETKQKLVYYDSIVRRIIASNLNFQSGLRSFFDENPEDSLKPTELKIQTSDNILEIATKKIEHDIYFSHYRKLYNDENILINFEDIALVSDLRKQVRRLLKDYFTRYNKKIDVIKLSVDRIPDLIKQNAQSELIEQNLLLIDFNLFETNIDLLSAQLNTFKKVLDENFTNENMEVISIINSFNTFYSYQLLIFRELKVILRDSLRSLSELNLNIVNFQRTRLQSIINS